ncbi:MAG: M28 family peptidase [Bacteroidales bacterium]|nr:M28 family peptidase [Bacteroidales bacterium]
MRKIFWILWTLLCTMPLARAQAQHEELAKRLKQHAFVLADDSLRGRKTGTVYAQKAANYISRQLQAMGARPYSDTSYEFPFTYRSGTQKGMNLLVLFPGTDPELKEEYIVLGAHYDHIGTTLSPSSDYIYNGADDNASGSSVLLELTRMLQAHPEQLKRSVLVAFFDAEEVGLEGSTYLANHFVVPVEQVKLMMSIDMVGYLRTSGFLEYSGYGTIADGKRLIGGLPWNAPYGKVKLKEFENSIFTATDTRGFAQKGCPTLAVSTGLKSPYHKVNDEAEGLDLDGMAYVTEHLYALVTKAASDPQFAPSGKVASIHRTEEEAYSLMGFSLMVRLGFGRLWLEDNELVGSSKFAYGLMAEWNICPTDKFELGLGAGYVSLGSGYTQLQSYRYHALEVPLRIQYNMLNMDIESFYLKYGFFVAPYYRYLFTGNLKNRLVEETKSWNEVLQQHQYGVALGIHYAIDKFLLEYRYSFDLSPMLSPEYYPKGYGRSYSIGLGWKF